jgi:8-oxo-dGTP pyrophosphatase MutT (NUDIX family)
MTITCGIFLMDINDRILLGHPTNHAKDFWSIPKGHPHKNETNIIAALREFEEETGINLNQMQWSSIRYLGRFVYPNRKKMLIAYCIKIQKSIDLDLIKCPSMVSAEVYGQIVPEMDQFMWAWWCCLGMVV